MKIKIKKFIKNKKIKIILFIIILFLVFIKSLFIFLGNDLPYCKLIYKSNFPGKYCMEDSYISYKTCSEGMGIMNSGKIVCSISKEKIDPKTFSLIADNNKYATNKNGIYYSGRKWNFEIGNYKDLKFIKEKYTHAGGYFIDKENIYGQNFTLKHNGDEVKNYKNLFSVGKKIYFKNITGKGKVNFELKGINGNRYKSFGGNHGYDGNYFVTAARYNDSYYPGNIYYLKGNFQNIEIIVPDNIFKHKNGYIICSLECVNIDIYSYLYSKISKSIVQLKNNTLSTNNINYLLFVDDIISNNYEQVIIIVEQGKAPSKIDGVINYYSTPKLYDGGMGFFKSSLSKRVNSYNKNSTPFKWYYLEDSSEYFTLGDIEYEDGTTGTIILIKSKSLQANNIIDHLYFISKEDKDSPNGSNTKYFIPSISTISIYDNKGEFTLKDFRKNLERGGFNIKDEFIFEDIIDNNNLKEKAKALFDKESLNKTFGKSNTHEKKKLHENRKQSITTTTGIYKNTRLNYNYIALKINKDESFMFLNGGKIFLKIKNISKASQTLKDVLFIWKGKKAIGQGIYCKLIIYQKEGEKHKWEQFNKMPSILPSEEYNTVFSCPSLKTNQKTFFTGEIDVSPENNPSHSFTVINKPNLTLQDVGMGITEIVENTGGCETGFCK